MNNGTDPGAIGNEATPLLVARDVHKTYTIGKRKLEVLRGVDLQIAKGEFLALRGASGAGKSTLLHLLGGLDLPDTGEVSFQGNNIKRLSNSALASWRNQKVGLIFQAYHLLPELSAIENVCIPARMARRNAAPVRSAAMDLLARVGLEQRFEHRPYELSGGEQQRVAIARALINDPELILADEPTGNLDSHTGEEIMQILTTLLAERKTTMVIATHSNRVAEQAHRVIQLVDGKIA